MEFFFLLWIFVLALILISLWALFFVSRYRQNYIIEWTTKMIAQSHCEVIVVFGEAHAQMTADLLARTLRAHGENVVVTTLDTLQHSTQKQLTGLYTEHDVVIISVSSHATVERAVAMTQKWFMALSPQIIAVTNDAQNTDQLGDFFQHRKNFSLVAPVAQQELFLLYQSAHISSPHSTIIGYGTMNDLAHIRIDLLPRSRELQQAKTAYRIYSGEQYIDCMLHTAQSNMHDILGIIVAITRRRGYVFSRIAQNISTASVSTHLPSPVYGINHIEVIDQRYSTWHDDACAVSEYLNVRTDLEPLLIVHADTVDHWLEQEQVGADFEEDSVLHQTRTLYNEIFILDATTTQKKRFQNILGITDVETVNALGHTIFFRNSSALSFTLLSRTLTPEHCVVIHGPVPKKLYTTLSKI